MSKNKVILSVLSALALMSVGFTAQAAKGDQGVD